MKCPSCGYETSDVDPDPLEEFEAAEPPPEKPPQAPKSFAEALRMRRKEL